MGGFGCNTMHFTALALEPMGVTVNICNAACLWESLSACTRKCNKTKMTNKINNSNDSTGSDLILLFGTVTSNFKDQILLFRSII